MFKLILSIIILSQSMLYAHCDGCNAKEHISTGTLSGNIKYDGKRPPYYNPDYNGKMLINMNADNICGSSHPNGKTIPESFIVDENLNFKNVLVYIKNIDYSGGVPAEAVVLDQKGCLYSPHVFGIMKGQELNIKNSDNTMHNIHSFPNVNKSFNSGHPQGVPDLKQSFSESEDFPFVIKCDVHPWMNAWALVLDHPYFAVTDENGNYKIENIPPGNYEVVVWQEYFWGKYKKEKYTFDQSTHIKKVEIQNAVDTIENFVFTKPK